MSGRGAGHGPARTPRWERERSACPRLCTDAQTAVLQPKCPAPSKPHPFSFSHICWARDDLQPQTEHGPRWEPG